MHMTCKITRNRLRAQRKLWDKEPTVSRRCQPSSRGGLLGDFSKMGTRGTCNISAIDPRKPTFARAEIRGWAQKWQILAPIRPFKNSHLLNLAISVLAKPCAGRTKKSSKGGTLTSVFFDAFSKGGSSSQQIRGYCTSVASEMQF